MKRAMAGGELVAPEEQARTSEEMCRACGGRLVSEFSAVIMKERIVEYFRCSNCRTLMLKNPEWLDAAYARVIVPDPDFGALHRSTFVARFVRRARGAAIIPRRPRCLDYGSGQGMLV